jgi:hypothetical protein
MTYEEEVTAVNNDNNDMIIEQNCSPLFVCCENTPLLYFHGPSAVCYVAHAVMCISFYLPL